MRSWKLTASILLAWLLVAGIGVAISYFGEAPKATGGGDAISFSRAHSQSNEMLARLEDYARSTPSKEAAPPAAVGTGLPDVNTMIERLAARLETTPQDAKGWRMLGWSYFHTARDQQAATAFARALELDPNSTHLKRAYEAAKAKAQEVHNLESHSSLPTP